MLGEPMMDPVRRGITSATSVMERSAGVMMMGSAVAEAVDVAAEVQEVIVEAEVVEDPEAVEASVSLIASPETRELASSPRRRGAAAAKATGATSRTM